MGYCIEKGESLAAAFGRIAAEEIDKASSELRRRDRSEAVHNARKSLKRLRALLRSMRVALPKQLYKTENRRLADAGREISPLRDVQVQLRVLGKLRAAENPAAQHIRSHWLNQQSTFVRRIPNLRDTVRGMLKESRQSLIAWPLREPAPEDLAAGIKRVYKKGRFTFKIARRLPTPGHLHEWRKKAKSLGYGLQLLKGVAPRKLSRLIESADALGDALGDDHDLFMVVTALDKEHKADPARDFTELSERIYRKRKKLQKRAFQLGEKIYAEKPRCFEERLDHYLRNAG